MSELKNKTESEISPVWPEGTEPINLAFITGIADKIRKVPRPMDFGKFDPGFTELEETFVTDLRQIVQYVMFEETERLKHRIRNHHHMVLSIDQGIAYRDNGMQITPWNDPALPNDDVIKE